MAWGRNALPKWGPGGSPNRGPKADQAQNGKTLIFNDPCRDFNVFSSPGVSFWTPKIRPKWGPNRIFDAEALRNPLGSLLERSWSLLEPKKVIMESLLGRKEPRDPQMSGRTPGAGGRGAAASGRGFRGVYT